MDRHGLDDTIVAVSTPVGEGGIGIVRLSGPESVNIADMLFRSKDNKKPSLLNTHTVHYGLIVNRLDSPEKAVDEVLLTVMRAPKSYTREDVVEINCHGGMQAVNNVLDLAVRCGARIALPGEFTKRAFLNGRIDLAQAEAVIDVIRAKTDGSLKVAVSQLEGELSKNVNIIREGLINIAAEVEAAIDFPEEGLELSERSRLEGDITKISEEIARLIKSYNSGMILREGVLAIICGKPNVGKSSLMNLLLKRDRVIVSPIPGTTRDAVEETINLGGIPIRLVDTAGISDAKDLLEKEGVKRSKRYLELSDIVILVLDSSGPLEKSDRQIIDLIGDKKKVVVMNKCDLGKSRDHASAEGIFKDDPVVEISVEQKINIDILEETIKKTVLGGAFVQGEGVVVSNARHKAALDKALGSVLSVRKILTEDPDAFELAAIDLKEAIFDLGTIVGKSVADDILDRIFSQFCIGK